MRMCDLASWDARSRILYACVYTQVAVGLPIRGIADPSCQCDCPIAIRRLTLTLALTLNRASCRLRPGRDAPLGVDVWTFEP